MNKFEKHKNKLFILISLILFVVIFDQSVLAQLNHSLIITSNNSDLTTFTLQGVNKNIESFIAIFRDSILSPNIINDAEIKISGIPDEELDLIIGIDSIYTSGSNDDIIHSFDITKNYRKCTGIIYSGKELAAIIKTNHIKNLIYLYMPADFVQSRTFNGLIIFLSPDLEWDFRRSH